MQWPTPERLRYVEVETFGVCATLYEIFFDPVIVCGCLTRARPNSLKPSCCPETEDSLSCRPNPNRNLYVSYYGEINDVKVSNELTVCIDQETTNTKVTLWLKTGRSLDLIKLTSPLEKPLQCFQCKTVIKATAARQVSLQDTTGKNGCLLCSCKVAASLAAYWVTEWKGKRLQRQRHTTKDYQHLLESAWDLRPRKTEAFPHASAINGSPTMSIWKQPIRTPLILSTSLASWWHHCDDEKISACLPFRFLCSF